MQPIWSIKVMCSVISTHVDMKPHNMAINLYTLGLVLWVLGTAKCCKHDYCVWCALCNRQSMNVRFLVDLVTEP
jgi:hypothetical protein